MKKVYRTWLRRGLALVLSGLILVDQNTVVLAQEASDQIVSVYEKAQESIKRYEKEREVFRQIVPEAGEGNKGEMEKQEETPVSDKASQEVSSDSFVSLWEPSLVTDPSYVLSGHEELEALYGEPVAVDEQSATFQVDNTHFVTLLGSALQAEPDTDRDFIARDAATMEVIETPSKEQVAQPGPPIVYESKDEKSGAVLRLPSTMDETNGLEIESKDSHRLHIYPEGTSYEKAIARENALLYNHVQEGVRIQYTCTPEGVKEDIILEHPMTQTFTYKLDASGYRVVQKGQEIHLYKKDSATQEREEQERAAFILSAPLMVDSAGKESTAVSLAARQIGQTDEWQIDLSGDEGWLLSPERVYPVRIDPTVTVPTDRIVEATTSTVHGTYQGTGYGYAGYITADMIKVPRAKDIGRSRMYFAINYDFASAIPDEAKIDSATLNIYQYRDYPETTAAFACYRIKESWNANNLTWDNSVGLSIEPSGERAVSAHKKGMHRFDIRESVNAWARGLAPNYGLVVMATDETAYGGAFYTPYSTGTAGQDDFTWDKRPSITINWSVPDPVDATIALDETTVNLRVMNQTDKKGKIQFQGVFADGMATPGALVAYHMNEAAASFLGYVLASLSYKYPDSSPFDGSFPNGTTKYKDKLANWQSAGIFTQPEFNTNYRVLAKASKNGVTGAEAASEPFLVYQVTRYDTLPKIAAYYGVDLAKLMFDNRVQDMLLVENNTLFVRNPTKHANEPYQPSALTDGEKAKIDAALMGRGLHCEFGFEPINLNTGNFYMEREDISIPDLGGDFAITRAYNSLGGAIDGVFGRGWSVPFSQRLSRLANGDLLYIRGDGSQLVFSADKEGGYLAPAGYDLSLQVEETESKTADFGDGPEAYPVYAYTITGVDRSSVTFNAFGALIRMDDGHGHLTNLTYDGEGTLRSVTSPAGKTYEIDMDEEGHIRSVTLPDGKSLLYGYDESGNLISYTDAAGGETSYTYDTAHRMLSWTDQRGVLMIQNTYDEEGRVIRQADANGHESNLVYQDAEVRTTDSRGNTTVYTLDDQKRTTRIDYADGTSRSMTYDEANHLSSETNEIGMTTTFAYDGAGHLLSRSQEGRTKTWTYDERGNVSSQTDEDGIRTEYTYDRRGNILTISVAGDQVGTYTYDAEGRVVSLTDAEGAMTTYGYDGAALVRIQNPIGDVTHMTYDDCGRLLTVTDAEGGTVSYTYDGEGRTLTETTAENETTTYTYDGAGQVIAVTDSTGNTVTFSYDPMYRRISTDNGEGGIYRYTYNETGQMTSLSDPLSNVTTYTYDAKGNMLTETDGAGDVVRYERDGLGRVISETDELGYVMTFAYERDTTDLKEVTDAGGNSVRYHYTPGGQLCEVSYPGGTKQTYTYDAKGRVASVVDEGGVEITYTYDGMSRLIRSSRGKETIVYDYDAAGRVIRRILPGDAVYTYAYDARGHIKNVTDPLGGKTAYVYDSQGRLLSLTDPQGATKTIRYDGKGNPLEETDSAGGVTKAEYNGQGRPVQVTDPLGHVSVYRYNQMEQITGHIDALGGESAYTYDTKGLLSSMTDAAGRTTSMTYTRRGELESVTTADGLMTTYAYDELGHRVRTQLPSGLVTEYTYDPKGQITEVSDSEGRTESYRYNAFGQTVRHIDAAGGVTEYAYDADNRLVKVCYPNDTEQTYRYDEAGNLLSVKNANGETTSYTYDKLGNCLTQTDAAGSVTTYRYDGLGRLVAAVNPEKEETTYGYDALGNLTHVTDGEGNTTTYGYDAVSNLILETDADGRKTLYTYDPLGRLLGVISGEEQTTYTYDAAGNLTSVTDGEGNTTSYVYDSMDQMIRQVLPKGNTHTYTYDASYALSSYTDPMGGVTTYENDVYGRPITMTDAAGGVYTYAYDALGRMIRKDSPLSQSMTYTYDAVGRLTQTEDQSGRTYRYGYDPMGRLTEVTNPLDLTIGYRYDKMGQLTDIKTPLGRQTSYVYDRAGRTSQEIGFDGLTRSYSYDKAGRLIQQIDQGQIEKRRRKKRQAAAPGEADPSSNARMTRFAYDKAGNLVEQTNPLGERNTWDYNTSGRLIRQTNAAGDRRTFEYDRAGRLIGLTDWGGGKTGLTYDANSNLLSVKDPDGRSVAYSYDEADRLIQAASGTGADTIRTSYTYDTAGRLQAVTDGLGQTTSYSHDLLGAVTSVTNAAGEKKTYTYDKNHRLSKVKKADETVISYQYNQLDQLIAKSFDGQDEPIAYAYDADGRRVSMKDLTGESTYTYDEAGRITGVRQGDGQVILYNYDTYGNLSSITYPDETQVRYGYDALDRLVKVTDREGKETTYTYDQAGDLTEVVRGNKTAARLSYDSRHQLLVLDNLDENGKRISRYTYTYDLSGLVLSETVETSSGTRVHQYGYDSAGQLVSEQITDEKGAFIAQTTYGYDGAGNRVQMERSHASADAAVRKKRSLYTYDEAGRLTEVAADDEPTQTYLYDKNGNRIAQLSDGEEIRTYQYDTQDRLLAVRDRKGLLQAALYNGDDDRVFLASRSERTGTVRLYEKKKEDQKAPDTSGLGDALAFFWYGFGLNMLETVTGGDTRTALVWDEVWDTLSYSVTRRTYMEQLEKEGVLLYPEQAGEKPSDTMPAWKKPSPGAEGGVTFDGMDGVYIPYRQIEDTYAYFEVRSFVNDINRPYTEVLAAYDETGTARETYTYGLSRLSVETKAVTGEGRASHLSGQILPSSHTGQDRKLYYGYTGRGSVAHLTDSTGAVFWQGDYDAFGLPAVDGGAVLSSTGGYTSGMTDAGFISGRQYDSGQYQPFGYNAEATDPASGLHYLRARYYDPQTGSFLSADGYPGSLDDPLSQNRYTYVQNDPVNHMDPSGHISLGRIWNSAKGALKKAGNFVVQGAKNVWNSGKKWVADAVSYTASKYQAAKAYFSNAFSGRGGSGTAKSAGAYSASSGGGTYVGRSRGGSYSGSSGGGGSGRYSGGGSSQPRSAYERAVQGGHSIFGWFQSKVKEARNIGRSWTKGLEKRFVHFCTTANRIQKGIVAFTQNINWKKVAIGVGVTLAVTAVVVATGGSAAPVLIGAAIGGGSGAVINGGITALSGGSVKDVAAAASDGFMWGAISGALGGAGTASSAAGQGTRLAKVSAAAGKNPFVSRGLDIAKDTAIDTAQEYTSTGRITTAGVATSLGTNLLFAGLGEIGQAKTKKTGGNTGYNTGYHTNNQIPEGYFQDKAGRWHRPNGQFASNVEIGKTSPSEHYLHRPYIRKGVIDKINENTKVDYKTGEIYDKISKKWVDPANVELGHTKGNEFWRLRDMAEKQGWTQAEFNDFMNNPTFYAWQDIKSNRSHKHELK